MKYKLVRGPDNIVWCSVQPLMEDTQDALKMLEQTNTESMNDVEKDIMEFNIIGMKAIYTFLGALVQESNRELYEQQKNTN